MYRGAQRRPTSVQIMGQPKIQVVVQMCFVQMGFDLNTHAGSLLSIPDQIEMEQANPAVHFMSLQMDQLVCCEL